MSIELTDGKRYQLEKESIENLLLSRARERRDISEVEIGEIMNLEPAMTTKLITALRDDGIIK